MIPEYHFRRSKYRYSELIPTNLRLWKGTLSVSLGTSAFYQIRKLGREMM